MGVVEVTVGGLPPAVDSTVLAAIFGALGVAIKGFFDLAIAFLNRPPRPSASAAEKRAYAKSGASKRGSSGPGTWAMALIGGATAGILILTWGTDSDGDLSIFGGDTEAASQLSETPGPSDSAAGTPAPTTSPDTTTTTTTPTATASPIFTPTATPLALKDEVEDFLAAWQQVTRESRDPQELGQFWRFPADWYNAKNLQNVQELVDRLPAPPPPGPRPCIRQSPVVESVTTEGTRVAVTARVDWEASDLGKSGSSPVTYSLERSDDGLPFRLRTVAEPANTPVACK